jgi:hypothetical protein
VFGFLSKIEPPPTPPKERSSVDYHTVAYLNFPLWEGIRGGFF